MRSTKTRHRSAGAVGAPGKSSGGQVLEAEPHAPLKRPRFAYRGDLVERGRRVRRVRAGAEVRVARQHVPVVRQVEALGQRFELNATVTTERAADPQRSD